MTDDMEDNDFEFTLNIFFDAPCIFCGYNGRDFYQKGSHKSGCPWEKIGGKQERKYYAKNSDLFVNLSTKNLYKNITVDRLRGQLQNCINHLELLKRHGYHSDEESINKCIESANKSLYETLLKD